MRTCDSNAIREIVILGGGTAGWSAAAALSRFVQHCKVHITLLDSPEIGTVGVGEASIPNIKNFNRYVGINEPEFIRSTNATFKLGIRFENWRCEQHSFFHPFSGFGSQLENTAFHQLFYHFRETADLGELNDYSLPAVLSKTDKFSQPQQRMSSDLADYSYAYHFDAALYAQLLRKVAMGRGVKHLQGKVEHVRKNNGFIDTLVLQNGQKLSGQLFIDCSGFRSVLLGQAMQVPYVSWRHWLPCDRAVALPCSAVGDEIAPYTTARARNAGWSWRIPLQNRVGNGYVYCSDYLTQKQAETDLLTWLEGRAEAEPRHLQFEAGMRQVFWHKNCVALGLASGFLEPLESTSINMVHTALSTLMEFFPQEDFDPRLAKEANRQFTLGAEHIRDFIILHYKTTQRADSELWRACREMSIPDSLAHKMETYKACGALLQQENESFKPASWLAIYDGMGVFPQRSHPSVCNLGEQLVLQWITQMRTMLQQVSGQCLSHRDFLNKVLATSQERD